MGSHPHMDMIRVLLADDEPLIRAGLSTILQASGHITVVGEASTGQQAVTEAQRLHPDVICMDIRMPDGDGLEATRLIQQLNPTPAVIVITTFDLDEYVFGALEAGACGILLKDSPMDALVEGVQRAALGEGLVDAALTRRVITESTRRKMTITPDTSTRLRHTTLPRPQQQRHSQRTLPRTLHRQNTPIVSHVQNRRRKPRATRHLGLQKQHS